MFLPWHRYYVQYFEDSLINKCGYTGVSPYWDWTQGIVRAVAHWGYLGVVTRLIATIFI